MLACPAISRRRASSATASVATAGGTPWAIIISWCRARTSWNRTLAVPPAGWWAMAQSKPCCFASRSSASPISMPIMTLSIPLPGWKTWESAGTSFRPDISKASCRRPSVSMVRQRCGPQKRCQRRLSNRNLYDCRMHCAPKARNGLGGLLRHPRRKKVLAQPGIRLRSPVPLLQALQHAAR